jgi:hypothetical protein
MNCNKCFEKIDALPIVKLLQIIAVATFTLELVAGIAHIISLFNQNQGNAMAMIDLLFVTLMTPVRILYSPLILLALAEIIKLMRVKNDQN